MSVKETVFDYIEKHPQQSLDQIISGLAALNRSSVRKYYYDYKKLKNKSSSGEDQKTGSKRQSARKSRKSRESIRNRVNRLLEKNPQASIDEICKQVKDANRKTILNYRSQWRRQHAVSAESADTPADETATARDSRERRAVHAYMADNPSANLNELRQIFPDNKKLVNDFRSWKRKQSEKLKAIRKSAEEAVDIHLPVESYKKTIDSLKQVIEKQKLTIESQRQKLKQAREQLSQQRRFNLNKLRSFLAEKLFNR